MPATEHRFWRPDGGAPAIRKLIFAAMTLGAAVIASESTAHAAEFATFAPFPTPSEPVRGETLDGALLSVAADPANTVLVHFFASWCEPCADELPALTGYVRERGETLRMIGVNVAEPASRAKKFVARFDLPGDVALDENRDMAKAFGVRGLPATIVIAPGGTKAIVAAGPVDWTASSTREALEELTR